ncbi:ABC transporter permease [Clostridium sp. JS66]|uniref:ABC transporter permease n=1 Tax=Clostridium sp. JS66 TaxID=3064705 RepID=UPI00298DF9C1|nr:ABC transporter permease [Clostridium sp. JS66]WPC39600.1 ABC transporter permease [Clostridium sp. JS66]
MTLHNIAIKNIKGNLNKFIMYYLSNTFVVMVFFIFANFLLSPKASSLKNMGQAGSIMTETVYLCEFVILIFTVVFTNYSISSFLKSREKEFGLLSMFGLTKSQVRNYVIFENFIVSLFSISTGIILGTLFSKLFFMSISAILILNTEIPLTISIKAVILTSVCFLILFQITCLKASYKIKSNNIIELLKGSRVAKPVPKFSSKKAILSIILIGFGYILAVFSDQTIVLTMFPILIVVVTGTYMLYSQFSIYITTKLKNNNKIFYKGINMITLSQIIYKLSDNTKILFAVSILSAVTLTASASVYSFQKTVQKQTVIDYPQDISFIENGLNTHNVISPKEVEKIFKSYGNEIEYKNKIILIKATNNDLSSNEHLNFKELINKKDFYIMSNTDYNTLASEQKKPSVKLNNGEVIVHYHNVIATKDKELFADKNYLKLNTQRTSLNLKLKNEINGGIINQDSKNSNTAVISDDDFNKLKADIKDDNLQVYYGYTIKNGLKAVDSVSNIKSKVPKEMKSSFSERVLSFSKMMEVMSTFFFIGTFIAVLFFIATCSIIYFKLFNEIQNDKHEFTALKKMGMPIDEIKKIVSTQCFIMFFLPFAVSFIHTSFAMKALSNILQTSLSLYLMIIVGIYFLLQTIYFCFSRSMYVRQINSWR